MPTFGKTTLPGHTTDSTISNDYQQCSKFTLSENGTVTGLSLYLTWNGAAGTQTLKAVCWADSAGSPAALKITSDARTLDQTLVAGYQAFTLPSSVALTIGDYWLGFIASTTAFKLFYGYDTVTNALKYKARSYASGPSDPYGTADGSVNAELGAYATYTTAAVAIAPVNPRRSPRRRVLQRM